MTNQAQTTPTELVLIGIFYGFGTEPHTFIMDANPTAWSFIEHFDAHLSTVITLVSVTNGIDQRLFQAKPCGWFLGVMNPPLLTQRVNAPVECFHHGIEVTRELPLIKGRS